jgi:membrane-bound ClpP family serine protease
MNEYLKVSRKTTIALVSVAALAIAVAFIFAPLLTVVLTIVGVVGIMAFLAGGLRLLEGR